MIPVIAFLDSVGTPEVLVIGLLALLMFGSKRLPEMGRAFGRAMREFKRATSGVEESIREVMRDSPAKPMVRPAAKQVPASPNPSPPSETTKPASATSTEEATPPFASSDATEPATPPEPSLQEPAPEHFDDDPYSPDRTAGGEPTEPKPSAESG